MSPPKLACAVLWVSPRKPMPGASIPPAPPLLAPGSGVAAAPARAVQNLASGDPVVANRTNGPAGDDAATRCAVGPPSPQTAAGNAPARTIARKKPTPRKRLGFGCPDRLPAPCDRCARVCEIVLGGLLRGQLAARCLDVAAAGQAHSRREPGPVEDGLERGDRVARRTVERAGRVVRDEVDLVDPPVEEPCELL